MRSKLLARALKAPKDFTLSLYFYRHELVADFVELANDIKYRLGASDDFLVSNTYTTVYFGDGGRLVLMQAASLDDVHRLRGLKINHLEIYGPVPTPVIQLAQTRVFPVIGD